MVQRLLSDGRHNPPMAETLQVQEHPDSYQCNQYLPMLQMRIQLRLTPRLYHHQPRKMCLRQVLQFKWKTL